MEHPFLLTHPFPYRVCAAGQEYRHLFHNGNKFPHLGLYTFGKIFYSSSSQGSCFFAGISPGWNPIASCVSARPLVGVSAMSWSWQVCRLLHSRTSLTGSGSSVLNLAPHEQVSAITQVGYQLGVFPLYFDIFADNCHHCGLV